MEKDNELSVLNEKINHKKAKITAARTVAENFKKEISTMQKEIEEKDLVLALQHVDSE